MGIARRKTEIPEREIDRRTIAKGIAELSYLAALSMRRRRRHYCESPSLKNYLVGPVHLINRSKRGALPSRSQSIVTGKELSDREGQADTVFQTLSAEQKTRHRI